MERRKDTLVELIDRLHGFGGVEGNVGSSCDRFPTKVTDASKRSWIVLVCCTKPGRHKCS